MAEIISLKAVRHRRQRPKPVPTIGPFALTTADGAPLDPAAAQDDAALYDSTYGLLLLADKAKNGKETD